MAKSLFLVLIITIIYSARISTSIQSINSLDDASFHTSTLLEEASSNDLFELGNSLSMSAMMMNHSNCREIWCKTQPNPFNNYYDDINFSDDSGFWLEPPPDDILFIPPPPIPPSLQSFFNAVENETMREFIIGEDPIEGVRCNFCKMFADSKTYQDDDGGIGSMFPSSSSTSKNNETFISLFYALIFSLVLVVLCIICLLIRYKKFRILSNHIWSSSNGVIAHHKSSSSSSASPSDTCLSPVVNEKSPQSIIMDASLASLGKKSTISTTGKYWKRVPNNVSGNILFMEDRRGLRSLGGSSTGISDHPYSDAASCTSSPVYAELDPAVAGCVANQPMIGPLIGRSSFGTPVYGGGGGYSSSNTYTEVPEAMAHRNRHHLDSEHHALSTNLLSDSSTYDNAAYLSASSQQFLQSAGGYNSRSLRRLAAQRSAAMNAAAASNQISTPLLSSQQYPPYPPINNNRQGFFPTGGRSMKKIRATNNGNLSSVNYYKYGNTVTSRPSMMNHYVSNNHDTSLLTNETDLSSIIGSNENDITLFNSFLNNSISNGPELIEQRKSSSSSSQYTEMPLIPPSSTFGNQINTYRPVTTMSETHSNNDLNSAASSSTASGNEQRNILVGTLTNSTGSSLTGSSSSSSIKRPLPPVPGTGSIQL